MSQNELINGYALPAAEFVRLITFPVQLVEVEVPEEEQSESEEEMSSEEGGDPMDTDHGRKLALLKLKWVVIKTRAVTTGIVVIMMTCCSALKSCSYSSFLTSFLLRAA